MILLLPHRNGFTLVELLVVMAILAILAGLAVPAIGLVQRQVRDHQCSNNLQQLATCMVAYRLEHDGDHPETLSSLVDGEANLVPKMLYCPRDPQKGRTRNTNRPEVWETYCNTAKTLATTRTDPVTGAVRPWEKEGYGISYFYEVGGMTLNECGVTFADFSAGWTDKLLYPPPPDPNPDPAEVERSKKSKIFVQNLVDGLGANNAEKYIQTYTWNQFKRHQLKFGNLGKPFPESYFPILRCFWHHKWVGNTTEESTLRKVNAVSYQGNVFWTIPYWEHDLNKDIPLPQPQ